MMKNLVQQVTHYYPVIWLFPICTYVLYLYKSYSTGLWLCSMMSSWWCKMTKDNVMILITKMLVNILNENINNLIYWTWVIFTLISCISCNIEDTALEVWSQHPKMFSSDIILCSTSNKACIISYRSFIV